MGIYILSEGSKTEPILYSTWLSHLLPTYKQKPTPDVVGESDYFIISSHGYPILLSHIENSIKDVNRYSKFKHFVISLDTDEDTPEIKTKIILDLIRDNHFTIDRASLHIIAQHRCIETWLLGNKRIIGKGITDPDLNKLLRNCDLINSDPEKIEKPPKFSTHAQFHLNLLKSIFQHRKSSYSKRNPGIATEKYYLNEIIYTNKKGHLASFSVFLQFIRAVSA
jgi:hypothetical protein